MKDHKHTASEDYASASNALDNHLDRFQGLSHAQRFIVQDQTTEKALEELKDIHPEVD